MRSYFLLMKWYIQLRAIRPKLYPLEKDFRLCSSISKDMEFHKGAYRKSFGAEYLLSSTANHVDGKEFRIFIKES